MDNIILKLEDISKEFPGVKALDKVSLEIKQGEIHALCGENGAGKSTLMKIISGVYPYTSGKIYIKDKEVSFDSTKDAQNHGISMIYQEFNLVPELSIAENIYLGNLPKSKNKMVDWKKLNEDTKSILKELNLDLNPKTKISDLSIAQTQMVEIAKCLSRESEIIIMDEPTAALTDEEIKILFELIDDLTKKQISIIYISHRMDEIFKISDRITVFRNGKYIKTMRTEDTNYNELVSLMVGKNFNDLYPERDYNYTDKKIKLDVKNLSGKGVKNIDFILYEGEILGIAGLMGAGNIEVPRLLYGANTKKTGEILIDGEKVNIKTPKDAIKNGISLVPEDRKNEGVVLVRDVLENLSMASLDEISKKGLINNIKAKEMAQMQVKNLSIKVSGLSQKVINLSGGNQQKIVFGKMLETQPSICMMNEPTRGIDIGAKAEIYKIINDLTKNNKSIIIATSDLEELIGLCDRIIVMQNGEIRKILKKNEATQEKILYYAAGGVIDE